MGWVGSGLVREVSSQDPGQPALRIRPALWWQRLQLIPLVAESLQVVCSLVLHSHCGPGDDFLSVEAPGRPSLFIGEEGHPSTSVLSLFVYKVKSRECPGFLFRAVHSLRRQQ